MRLRLIILFLFLVGGKFCFSQLFAVRKDGKWGYINRNGRIVTELTYKDVWLYPAGHKAMVDDGSGYFLINTISGEKLSEKYSEERGMGSNGFIPVLKDSLWGYIDTLGKVVIPAIYKYAGKHLDGIAMAGTKHQQGYLDEGGNFFILDAKKQYENIKEGYLKVMVTDSSGKKKYGVYDTRQKKEIIAPIYTDLRHVKNNRIIFEKKGGNGILNLLTGREITVSSEVIMTIIPWSEADGRDSLYTIKKNGKFGIIDHNGKIILKPKLKYDWVRSFSNGYAIVEKNKKFGMINAKGTQIIKPQYTALLPLSEGFVGVQIKDKYGFMDITGKTVIPAQYDQVNVFQKGLANVYLGKGSMYSIFFENAEVKMGYINREGKIIWYPSN